MKERGSELFVPGDHFVCRKAPFTNVHPSCQGPNFVYTFSCCVRSKVLMTVSKTTSATTSKQILFAAKHCFATLLPWKSQMCVSVHISLGSGGRGGVSPHSQKYPALVKLRTAKGKKAQPSVIMAQCSMEFQANDCDKNSTEKSTKRTAFQQC